MKKKIEADPNRKKDYPVMKAAIHAANVDLKEARSGLYKSVKEVWLRYEGQETASTAELSQIIINAKRCAFIARTEVENLYPWAGMDAIVPETDINRIWRDIHTASQHILLSPFSSSSTNI